MNQNDIHHYRILLVDDHVSLREALASVIDMQADMRVVAQAGSIAEARNILDSAVEIDLAAVDLALPDGDGTSLIGPIQARRRGAKVLILTASVEPVNYARAIEAGAGGVLNKIIALRQVVDGLRRVGEGAWLFSPDEIVALMRLTATEREKTREAQAALARLTPREREVLAALAEGLTNKDIAARLYMTVETERTHMMNIIDKLGVHSRLQAILFAIRHGAVSLR